MTERVRVGIPGLDDMLGGGLISGIAVAAKAINSGIKIIGVEPEGAPTLKHCIEQGCICELPRVQTIADGVAVRRAGDITYKLIKQYVDDIITVSDYELMEFFLMLLEKHKLVAENAGILSLAALKKLGGSPQQVVSVVSGGNIDVLTISAMIDQGLVNRCRIFCFSVELPDKLLNIVPGNPLYRAIIPAILEVGWAVPHHPAPLPLRHLRRLHIKGPADRHAMLRLIIVPPRFISRRPHRECPGGDEDKGPTQRRAGECREQSAGRRHDDG